VSPIGSQVESLCAASRRDVVLVAPFVNGGVLRRLLSLVNPGVALRCVTRWRPDEIAAGYNDLEIWPLLRERPCSSLWLRPDLHAKYYRADAIALVGSANMTSAGFGWSAAANLEFLAEIDGLGAAAADFETELFCGSVEVDDSVYAAVAEAVDALPRDRFKNAPAGNGFTPKTDQQPPSRPSLWVPILRSPEDLYPAYVGKTEGLTTASREAANVDLAAFAVPPGLARGEFAHYIGSLLLQKPIVHRIDTFVAIPRLFGAVTALLSTLPCAEAPDFDADRVWQTLMRWLRFFLPGRYTLNVPRYSEIFARSGK